MMREVTWNLRKNDLILEKIVENDTDAGQEEDADHGIDDTDDLVEVVENMSYLHIEHVADTDVAVPLVQDHTVVVVHNTVVVVHIAADSLDHCSEEQEDMHQNFDQSELNQYLL